MSYKYALKYKVETENRPEGYLKEDAGSDGLTDAFLGISILMPDDGSYSQAITIRENAKKNRLMTQEDIFKVWMMLGMSLSDKNELKGWKKLFVQAHTKSVREFFKKIKEEE